MKDHFKAFIKDVGRSISKYFTHIKDSGREMKIFTFSTLLLILLFCLDFLDKPSKLLVGIPRKMCCTLFIGTMVLLGIYALNKQMFQNYKNASMNYIDFLSIIGLIIGSISSLLWSVTEVFSYKTTGAFILFGISAISIIIRLVVFYKSDKKLTSILSNNAIYDLQSIYDDKFDIEIGNPILISEKDVDYDLLGRKSTINQLYKCISSYKSDTSYVIGLIGAWGSGKTTIINNVKKKLKGNPTIIYIDDFDPWVFGTQEALLHGMFDKILKQAGIKFSLSQTEAIINNLNNIMIDATTDIKFAKALINKLLPPDEKDVSYLTAEISNYLTLNDKTVVFFIDNIDRAEADNIIFMLKLIGTVFNLPNIVYVLSYDLERVNEILKDTQKINPKYIEKIIQQELYVPPIQYDHLKDIYKTCICNILNHYGVTNEEINIYSPIINFICDTVTDLRRFKRLINSVFPNVFLPSYKLDKFVLLAMETFHFLDWGLYDSILKHGRYFISADYIYNDELRRQHFDKKEFDVKAKEFFNEFFNKYASSKTILSAIFPYVYQYVNRLSISDIEINENVNMIRQNVPIYSLKFFELYFTYGTNSFLEERNIISELVKVIIDSKNSSDVRKALHKGVYTVRNGNQKDRLELFQLHLDEIPHRNLDVIIESLWENLCDLDDTPQFLSLSAKDRAVVIITTLLIKMDERFINEFILLISNDYSRILYINDILYWLNSSKLNSPQTLKEKFEDLYSKMCRRVIENKIDLYSDKYYRQYNIPIGLFSFYNDSEDGDIILKDYMMDIYKDHYVYRVIADIISMGVGSHGYSYGLENNCFKKIYISEEEIVQSLENNPPSNESEEIIKQIFEKYQKKETVLYQKYGISFQEPISFKL